MVVIGADSYTLAAVSATTGEPLGEKIVQVGAKGFAALLIWRAAWPAERVWALEDCHMLRAALSGSDRQGERVLRIPTR